jgi:GT2 family glycosyltransferase
MNKISICTVCMNRLTHLSETLPANIIRNMDYPDIEFVVLDYNSKDDMECWIRSNLSHYIESGILKYYRTYEPDHFRLSHSKNMVVKLSGGDICCLIDADNYAGANYATWVGEVFRSGMKRPVITTLRKESIPFRDQGGKLCFYKDHFIAINGFDESLVGYGIEDVDLVNRLERSGGERVFIENREFLDFISHSTAERLENYRFTRLLENIYLRMPDLLKISGKDLQIADFIKIPNSVLYLFKDNTFIKMAYEYNEMLKDKSILAYSGWTTKKEWEQKGTFQRTSDGLSLSFEDGSTMPCKWEDNETLSILAGGEISHWKNISTDNSFYYLLVKAYSECLNRIKYIENETGAVPLNTGGWGKGTVYSNFDTTNPIQLV